MDGPHGYLRLSQVLKTIEADPRSDDRGEDTDTICRAGRFAMGSPSEFLGESRIALQRLLDADGPLRPRTEKLARATVEAITAGFRVRWADGEGKHRPEPRGDPDRLAAAYHELPAGLATMSSPV